MTTTTTFKHKKIDKSVIHNGLNGFNGWVGGSRTANLCRAFPRSSIACSLRRWRALDIHHCPSRGSIWRCFRHLTPMMAMAWSGWCRVQMSLHSLSAVDNYRKALNLKNTTNRAGKENGDEERRMSWNNGTQSKWYHSFACCFFSLRERAPANVIGLCRIRTFFVAGAWSRNYQVNKPTRWHWSQQFWCRWVRTTTRIRISIVDDIVTASQEKCIVDQQRVFRWIFKCLCEWVVKLKFKLQREIRKMVD